MQPLSNRLLLDYIRDTKRSRLYTISSSSSLYVTYKEENDMRDGYATISADENIFYKMDKNSQQRSGLRRVNGCSNLLDGTFTCTDNHMQLMKRIASITKDLRRTSTPPLPLSQFIDNHKQLIKRIASITKDLKRTSTPPLPLSQFIPVCTSTPLVRSCIDIPYTSSCEEKLHFHRLQNKQLSVPSFKPPPPPKEAVCDDKLVVLDDNDHNFWEMELPRDYSGLISDSATIIATDEPTLLLKDNSKLQLDETFIEEITIYADPGVESPLATNKTFIQSAKTAAARFLWKFRQEILMSKSITV
ncbi:unnamed protein product [Strongylus vulgaris]|uniref:Uncharacterized protein n=1 Tax=Strongylus vulgaris TaxID=40348 RepID=A0A3P7KYY9_STRVU|nr:unnamed protein product [Strongylus vulgaris]